MAPTRDPSATVPDTQTQTLHGRPGAFRVPEPPAPPSTLRTALPVGRPCPVSADLRSRPSTLETLAAPPVRPTAQVGDAPDEEPPAPASLDETVFRGSSSDAAKPPPRPDAGDALDRNLALARMQERMLGVEPEAVKIGRFVVLRKLGQGAMGIVYLAYDPKLDRRVALKLVDTSALGSEVGDAQTRLEREAQAAAALGHPNVVTVYDVGHQGDDVFLAMEYVEGTPLTAWMKQEHDWRTVVEVFVQIARGLAAAHDADLVHRDFKPDNVLMGHDGRPRVADFGLARPTEGWSARDAAKMLVESGPSSRSLALRSANALASTGEVCGTPAYMAPEQFVGVDVTATSDQFGFCASLFEALFGHRPFKGQSVTELAVAVIENNREPLPSEHRVPRAVVRAVLQGLEPAAADRHPSMHALVDRLDGALRARTRNRVLAGAAFVAVAAGGFGAQAATALEERPCDAAHVDLDAVWNPARRTTVHDALAQAGLDADAVERLDRYAEAWTAQRVSSCEATRVSGQQSDEVLGLRTACLDRLSARLDAAATALSSDPNASTLGALATALPPTASCEDVYALASLDDAHNTDGEGSLAADAAWTEASATMATLALRQHEPASDWRPLAQQLLETGTTHDLQQAIGYGRYWLGVAAAQDGDPVAALAHYEAGMSAAARSPDPRLVPGLLLKRAEAHLLAGALADASATAELGRSMAARVRDDRERALLETEYDATRSFIADRRGRPEQAASLARAALQRDGLPARLRERLHTALGSACRAMGDMPCAFQHHGVALELASASPMPVLELAGRHANVGLMYADAGDGETAVDHLRRADALVHETFGQVHPMRGRLLSDIGGIEGAMLDAEAGEKDLLAGLAIHSAQHGETHPALVEPLIDLTKTRLRLGKLDAAVEAGRRAVRIADATLEGPERFGPRGPLAEALMAREDTSEAAQLLTDALSSLTGPDVHPMQRAELQFALARAQASEDPQAAAETADAALATLAGFEPGRPLQDAITQWREAALPNDAPQPGRAPAPPSARSR